VALDLMPVSTEAPRCSEFARSIDVLPPGSGLFLERVVLVSVPLPWPKPALNHELLRPLGALLSASAARSRLFAMEPIGDHLDVEVYERSGVTTTSRRWELTQSQDLPAVIGAIAACAIGQLDTIDVAGVSDGCSDDPVATTFLVCTQGSHDSCCGTSGVALADEIESSRSAYVVRRVSHTGGHRFSPTFLSFPSGRMWAFADIGLADRIASNQTTAVDFAKHARGWWGAKVGAAQVAECAVRVERPDLAQVEAQLELLHALDGQTVTQFVVTLGDTSWQVEVRVEREIPSIACEAPGGLPAKPSREFAWSIAPL
jgi:hypothetical protein